jgi:hypothetical protein
VLSHKPVPAFRFLLGILSLATTVGCGSSGSGKTTFLNNSTGHFSNASLKGSYVYQIHGATANGVAFVPYRQIGVFSADGSGNITSSTDDSSFSIAANGTAFTGSYTVSSDGTGFMQFNSSSLGGALSFAITLVGTSEVKLIENDPGINAAGIAELQDSTSASTVPGGTFVFRLHQEASAQSANEEASQVGAFVLTGGAGTGAMDQLLGASLTSPTLTATFNAPVASGRGTANLFDTSANFTTTLVYYTVNSSELALLISNPSAVGSGSAEAQSGVSGGTGLSGSYAFAARGDDAFLDGLATVGQFTANSGSISGTEDAMEDGNYSSNVSDPSTCYTAGSAGGINGRVVATDGPGPTCSGNVTQIFWMVSPSRAFFLDNGSGQFQDGTADLQSVNSFSASSLSGQFVLVMDGLDRTGEQFGTGDLLLSRVGTLQFASSNLTLNEFVNELNGGQSPGILSGSVSVSSNGRVVGNLNNSSLALVMYAVSGTQAYVMQQNDGIITSGTAVQQQQ